MAFFCFPHPVNITYLTHMHFDHKNILLVILRFFLGGFFIFSGLVKLYPIELFELIFIDAGISSWKIAPFLSRIIISAELFVGLLLIFNIKLKTFTLKAAFLLLIMFTAYVVYILISEGNDASCGCLGSKIELTPIESLIKNVVLLAMLVLLMRNAQHSKWQVKWVLPLILLVSCSLPFILNPVQIAEPNNPSDKELPYPINLDNIPHPVIGNQSIDLSRGEKILAFMLVNCPHCKTVAYKLAIADKKYDLPGIFFVFRGSEEDIATFMAKSKSDFPYVLLDDVNFFKITRGVFPTILYIKNSYVHKYWTGKTLTYSEMEKFSKLNVE